MAEAKIDECCAEIIEMDKLATIYENLSTFDKKTEEMISTNYAKTLKMYNDISSYVEKNKNIVRDKQSKKKYKQKLNKKFSDLKNEIEKFNLSIVFCYFML